MMYYPYYVNVEKILTEGINFASSFSLVNVLIFGFGILVNYLVLEKAGERGWKSLIPFYRDYLEYKLYWNKNLYWINLIMPFVGITCFCIGSILYYNTTLLVVTFVLGTILLITSLIFDIGLKIKKGKCFGESGAFGIGLILLNTIFCAILAFDKKCQYIGNVKVVDEQENAEDQPQDNTENQA